MQENITLRTSRRSFRVSRKLTIRVDQLALQTAMLLLCLGAVRAGHTKMTLDWNLLLMLLNGFLVFASGRLNLQTKGIYPFVLVVGLEIPVQWLLGSYFGLGSAVSGFISLFLTIVLVAQIVRQGYEACLWKVLNAVSLFSCLCLCIQMMALFAGIRLDLLPFLGDYLFKAWEFTASFRPCSLFSEPSHLAEVCLLSLYYYLFIERKIKKALILIVGLFLSTSGLGIVGAVLLLVYYVLNLNVFSHNGKIRKYCVLLLTFVVGIVILFWAQNTDLWIIKRIMSGGTSAARVWRSFDLFHIMDPAEKLFGIGLQNQAIYLNYHSITLPHDTAETLINREFAQTLGYILCTTGLVGFATFMFPFVRMFIKQDYHIKALVLLFMYVCVTCCIFSRHIFGIYLVMIYATVGMVGGQRSNDYANPMH